MYQYYVFPHIRSSHRRCRPSHRPMQIGRQSAISYTSSIPKVAAKIEKDFNVLIIFGYISFQNDKISSKNRFPDEKNKFDCNIILSRYGRVSDPKDARR